MKNFNHFYYGRINFRYFWINYLNSSNQAVEHVVYALENLTTHALPYTATANSAGLITVTFTTRVGTGEDEWANWTGKIFDSTGNVIWQSNWSNDKSLTVSKGIAIKKGVTYYVYLTKTSCGIGDGSGAGSGHVTYSTIQVGAIKN